jgi:Family of unknown function (DUF5678)
LTVAERELKQAVKAERRLSKRLGEYAGEWIAIRDHKIVAHAKTISDLIDQVRDQLEDLDGIRRVPTTSHAITIL